ncbi:MAG TPA: radical SAM protein [Roseococcus sp.]|jgi:uncharacterized protein|nr:radical SAM protein [Roseococcus sp.]
MLSATGRAGLAAAGGPAIAAALARGAAFRRVLKPWPEALSLAAGVSIGLARAHLSPAGPLAKAFAALDEPERREASFDLAAGCAPLDLLARVPFGVAPFDDPALSAVAEPRVEPSGQPSRRHLVLIAKLTRHCNLRCTYCNDWREGPGHGMPPAVQAAMLRRAAEDADVGSVRIVWHGGEPALLGVRRSLAFLWLQARLRRPGQAIANSVQTNAVGLQAEMVDLWHAFGMRVSVSLDGTRAVHDRQRLTRRGEASFDAAAAGIALLRKAGIFSGALVVVSPEIAALPPRMLVSELLSAGVHEAAFLPVRPDAKDGAGPYLPPEAFARFLIGVFETLRSDRSLAFDARELDALYLAYKGRPTGFCELNGPCLGDYFAIEADGRAMHCDKFLGAEDYVLGNILETGFAAMRASRPMHKLQQREAARRAALKDCRWYGHCQGWCPHEARIATLRGVANGCCGLAPVFEHFAALEAASLREAAHA